MMKVTKQEKLGSNLLFLCKLVSDLQTVDFILFAQKDWSKKQVAGAAINWDLSRVNVAVSISSAVTKRGVDFVTKKDLD